MAGRAQHGPFGRPERTRVTLALLIGPAVLYLLVFAIYPLVHSLSLSFTDLSGAASSGGWVGLRNYAQLLGDPQFWNAAGNSAIMVAAGVAVQVLGGLALALFFNQHLRGSWIVRGILLLPMLLTPVVVGLMWRALLNPDWGLINWALETVGLPAPDWLGSVGLAKLTIILVDSWQWTPFVFMIVFARLQSLPEDVFEAAAMDGAGPWTTFRRITLPMLAPAIVFAAVFRTVDAFRSFDLIYGLSYGGPARGTTTLAFFAFQNGFQFQNYGYAAASAYAMLLILIGLTTLLLRWLPMRREA
jgi:multiple sugar transport system permease protein